MKPSDSPVLLEQLINGASHTVATLTAAEAIRFMLAFYREVRAESCALDDDGDQLLFQWGVYDWHGQESFHYDITRQFIEPGTEDDDGMSQLSLTVHYPANDNLRALDEGHHWCAAPADVETFEALIHAHPATHAVAALKPLSVSLQWELI